MVNKTTWTSLLLLFVIGCGGTDFFTVDTPDDIYDKIPAYDADKCIAPYDIERFRPTLKKCKLQYPNGTAVSYGKLRGFKAPYFYGLDDAVWFVVDKKADMEKIRSELREKGEWQTSEREKHLWHATLRCLKPKSGVDSYTWMQIHGNNATFDYPILRLMWVRNHEGFYDHLWAIVIVSDPYADKRYEWIDLGKRPDGFFDADVKIVDNSMDIILNGKRIKHYDVTYWQEVENYFKAGIYVNRHEDYGKAAVVFKNLKMY